MGNAFNTLILGMNIEQFTSDMLQLRRAYLLGMFAALLLLGLAAWLLAQRALRPVAALTQTAEQITARGLDQRLTPMSSDQEFNRLITVFNAMMDRLEKSFQQAMHFSADASHELKTPLARLQVELEQALKNAPAGSLQQTTYSSLLDEIHRLKMIVQKLLLLALADAGQLRLNIETINLSEMIEGICEDMCVLAPHLKTEVNVEADVTVQADSLLLGQVLQNLASNSVKYNHDGGWIAIDLIVEHETIEIRISNSSQTIPEEDRERIFQRFHRGDSSRNGNIDGTGLGLSLSREIIRAHNGELDLLNPQDEFVTFRIKIPT